MFLKVLRGLSGEAFLESEINQLEIEVKSKRIMQFTILVSGFLMLITALSSPKQRKDFLLWELGLASGLGFGSALIEVSRREIEHRYISNVKLSREVYKTEVSNRYAKEQVVNELSLHNSILNTLTGMPHEALPEYAERYNLPRGLYASLIKGLFDNPSELKQATQQAIAVKHDLGIAKPEQQLTDLYINSKPMALVKALSQKFPEYVKDPDDPKWLLELIESSSNPDMSSRANQHFIIVGSTQDGKSTLAGVIANGIAKRSEDSAVIAVHDAKKIPGMMDITRWLCPFTYKIDGYENTENWIKICRDIAKGQFERVGKVGGSCKGVREVIIIQDEVNTVYGQGKGYGNMISPETAKNAQSEWLYQATNMAGLRWHMMLLGQSPLAGDTGLSIPAMNNCCFIAMGQTSGYVLDPKNRANFIRNTDESILKMFAEVAELLQKEGVRFALVRPTRGNPFIALIPQFDVDRISEEMLGLGAGGSTPKIEPGEEDSPQPSNLSLEPEIEPDDDSIESDTSTPVTVAEDTDKTLFQKTFLAILQWMKVCFSEHEVYPSHDLIRKAWHEKTGDNLSDVGLEYLISMLMKKLDEDDSN